MDLKKSKTNNELLVKTAAEILPTLLMRIGLYNEVDQERAVEISIAIAKKLINKAK